MSNLLSEKDKILKKSYKGDVVESVKSALVMLVGTGNLDIEDPVMLIKASQHPHYQLAGDLLIVEGLVKSSDRRFDEIVEKASNELYMEGIDVRYEIEELKKLRKAISDGMKIIETELVKSAKFSPIFESLVREGVLFDVIKIHPTMSIPTMGVLHGDLMDLYYNPLFVKALSVYDRKYFEISKEYLKERVLSLINKGAKPFVKIPHSVATVILHEIYHYFLQHTYNKDVNSNYINRITTKLSKVGELDLANRLVNDENLQQHALNVLQDLIINEFYLNGKVGFSVKAEDALSFQDYYPSYLYDLKILDLFDDEEIRQNKLDPNQKVDVYFTISAFYIHKLIEMAFPGAIGAMLYDLFNQTKPPNPEHAVDEFYKFLVEYEKRFQRTQEQQSQEQQNQQRRKSKSGKASSSPQLADRGCKVGEQAKENLENEVSKMQNKEKEAYNQASSPQLADRGCKVGEQAKENLENEVSKMQNKEKEAYNQAKQELGEGRQGTSKDLEKKMDIVKDMLARNKNKSFEEILKKIKENLEKRIEELRDIEKHAGSGKGKNSAIEDSAFEDLKVVRSLEDFLGKELLSVLIDFTKVRWSIYETGGYDPDSFGVFAAVRKKYPEVAGKYLEKEYFRKRPKGAIFVLDVSGSMSTEDLRVAFSVIKSLAEERNLEFGLIALGSSLEDAVFFDDLRNVEDIKNETVDRGGGTDMTQALVLVKEIYEKGMLLQNKYDKIIFLTDGVTPWEINDENLSKEVEEFLQETGMEVKVVVISDYYKSVDDYIRKNPDVLKWIETPRNLAVINHKYEVEVELGL